jgi:hypothetical protein
MPHAKYNVKMLETAVTADLEWLSTSSLRFINIPMQSRKLQLGWRMFKEQKKMQTRSSESSEN